MNYNDELLMMSFLGKDGELRVGMNVSLIIMKSFEDGCKHPDDYFGWLMSLLVKSFHSEFTRTQPDHPKINYEQFTAFFMESVSYWMSKHGDPAWEAKFPNGEFD